MATYQPENRDPVLTPPATTTFEGFRVAWGGVWTGLLVAIGVFLILTTLGLAIGISSADVGPNQNLDAGALGTGAAIWSGVTLLIALFIGGLFATRTGAVYDKTSGMIEGVLVWVLSVLAIIYMASSGIGMLAGTVSSALGGVTQTAKSAVSSIDVTSLSSGDVNQVIDRLNSPNTVRLVSAATGMSQDEARSALSGVVQRVDAARSDPAQAATQARQGLQDLASRAATRVQTAAAKAQPYASATAWTSLIVMLVSLLAAIFGAMMGCRQIRRRLENV